MDKLKTDRKIDKKSIIIDRPEALSSFRRGTEWSITTLGWMLWFFLCRPLILVFLWFIGVEIFYEHMLRLGGLKGLKDIWGIYLFIILVIFFIVRGWNVYNYFKFRKKDRRQQAKPVIPPELEDYFRMEPATAATIQTWPNVAVDFADHYALKLRDPSGKNPQVFQAEFNPSSRAPHPDPKRNGKNGNKRNPYQPSTP